MSSATSRIGLRSEPPPNHQAPGVQNIRVFMCTAGHFGERMWATRLTPEAQNRGSSASPSISRRALSERCACAPSRPCTAETLTPTFSKSRPPRITDISPPPPSDPSSAARRVSVRSKRPGGRSEWGPSGKASACTSSSASKAAQIVSRSSANQAAARVFSASPTGFVVRVTKGPPVCR